MKRRNFVASVLASGVAAAPTLMAADHEHDKEEVSGPQANVTVAFGQWKTDPPLDRFTAATPNSANNHHLQPFEAQIKSGGSVTFAISGFHILGIYAPGTDLDDVSLAVTIPIPLSPPGFPPVINDPLNRVYWGVNPFTLIPPPVPPSPVSVVGPPLDRVETVTFGAHGTYLVICTFTPHFSADPALGKMHGYVKVLR